MRTAVHNVNLDNKLNHKAWQSRWREHVIKVFARLQTIGMQDPNGSDVESNGMDTGSIYTDTGVNDMDAGYNFSIDFQWFVS